MNLADEIQRDRAVRRGIQFFVQLPVEFTPARGRCAVHALDDLARTGDGFGRQVADRPFEQIDLESRANIEVFLDFGARQARDDRSLVRNVGDESFGLELLERRTYRYVAHAEALGDFVLSQRVAMRVRVGNDQLAERVRDLHRKRFPLDSNRSGHVVPPTSRLEIMPQCPWAPRAVRWSGNKKKSETGCK